MARNLHGHRMSAVRGKAEDIHPLGMSISHCDRYPKSPVSRPSSLTKHGVSVLSLSPLVREQPFIKVWMFSIEFFR
jgi:hypothetical protein